MSTIRIFTDGSCLGNPGPGGFGFVAVKDDVVLSEKSGYELDTTNNRMELVGAIEALASVSSDDITNIPISDDDKLEIHTDSKYVKKGITEWISNWKANNWKRSKNNELKNVDLWKKLDELNERLKSKLKWEWVKGHAGNKWNDYADKLAVAGSQRAKEALNPKKHTGLTASQKRALDLILDGKSVFVTGPGGCGKTFLVNHFVKHYKGDKRIAVTSTTGTSALHIHGTTLHSWAGIGLGKGSVGSIVTKIKKKRYLKDRWMQVEILIIDEISMMSPVLFDKLEKVARMVRRSTERFGGIQLIITGDFLQLPCVESEDFCFEAQTWPTCIDETIYMPENLRQSDPVWQKCLDEVRMGDLSDESKKLLKSCTRKKNKANLGIKPTLLYPLNADVAEINQECLDELCEKTGEVNDYVAELEVYDKKLPAFKIEKFKKDCPAVENLSLAVGCQVMLLWNLDLEQGLVNGSRGVVTRFINDIPLVRFLDGQSRLIDYHLWELEDNDTKLASIEQLPLKLAYAISIHKSQGCSLDYVITDLDSIFEYGQAYVALSRVRTSGGLIIRNLRLKKIKANPKAKAYYQSLC